MFKPSAMTIQNIEQNVLHWAFQRHILLPDNDRNQALKLAEEAGELCGAILKNNQPAVVDGIGDCLVVLTILAHQRGTSLQECFEAAWNEIKDRQGVTVGGTFLKQ
jgi:phosphoribosyl-ATP pyrophosphohydrolase